MPTPSDKLIKLAVGELGVQEHPYGSNNGERVRQYQEATWLRPPKSGYIGWPWCVAFVQWIYENSGVPFPYKGAGAYAFFDWSKKVHWNRGVPEEGFIAVFNVGSGHVGIVEDFTGSRVMTIDGNTSHMVRRASRSRSLVRGYIDHPRVIDTDAHVPNQPKPPIWEVVTSESGHTKIVFSGTRKGVARKLGDIFENNGGITVRRRKKKT